MGNATMFLDYSRERERTGGACPFDWCSVEFLHDNRNVIKLDVFGQVEVATDISGLHRTCNFFPFNSSK